MRLAVLPAGHHRFEVLRLGRRVAAELSGEAIDPASALSMADRMALVTLAIAVDTEASRLAGVEPMTAQALPTLAEALTAIEREISPNPEPISAAG